MDEQLDNRLARLITRTEQFSERLSSSLDNAQPAEATSEGGSIRVKVAPGGTVEAVDVYDGWRRESTAEGLGSLVLTTMGAAFAQQFGKWAEMAPDALDRPAPPPRRRPVTQAAPPPRGPAGDRAVPEAIRRAGGLSGAIDELVASLRTVADRRHEGHDRGGHVTAEADGRGTLVHLQFDEDWLEGVAPRLVGPAVVEAMASAVARARAGTDVAQVVSQSRLGRLQADLTDPRPSTD